MLGFRGCRLHRVVAILSNAEDRLLKLSNSTWNIEQASIGSIGRSSNEQIIRRQIKILFFQLRLASVHPPLWWNHFEGRLSVKIFRWTFFSSIPLVILERKPWSRYKFVRKRPILGLQLFRFQVRIANSLQPFPLLRLASSSSTSIRPAWSTEDSVRSQVRDSQEPVVTICEANVRCNLVSLMKLFLCCSYSDWVAEQ